MTESEIRIKAQEWTFMFFAALPDKEKERLLGLRKSESEYLDRMQSVGRLMLSYVARL
jgi:hypothetical protein